MKARTFALPLLAALLAPAALAEPATRATDAQLAKSLEAIQNNRLDVALNEVDSLLRSHPKFKLAHLVKGDLLMAQAGNLNAFGSAANAPRDKIEDLRQEARARLQRMLAQPDSTLTPQFLWQLDAQQSHILVVDTSRSTLFVYENRNGTPRYVTDFYITIGKLGAVKKVEGDQRTPIGVYFVQSELSKNKLADLYGNGAFPLNYPNEWDQRNRRTGSGIWLHGTPSDTYSRPPRASNGCVVVANEDFDRLAPYLQVGVTPVIISERMNWLTTQDRSEHASLQQALEQWRSDWASRDTAAYLSHYARNFAADGKNYEAWAQHKQRVNGNKSWIKVGLSNVSMFAYPENPGMVVVSFDQDYASDTLSNHMKKRQYWQKTQRGWQIIYEGAA